MDRDLSVDNGRTTAADLIAQLSKLEPDTPIFVSGYEGGFHDATLAESITVEINANSQWYYGPHEDSEEANCEGFLVAAK